jgi:hypothetical protein
MYFVFVYEDRTMKPGEIVPKGGKSRWGRKMEGVNLRYIVNTYVMSQCIFLYNYYMIVKNKIIKDFVYINKQWVGFGYPWADSFQIPEIHLFSLPSFFILVEP